MPSQYAVDHPTFPVNHRGQGDGIPKACAEQAAADSQVRATPQSKVFAHTQGEKDELTSCRGTVQSAPPLSRKGWAARNGK